MSVAVVSYSFNHPERVADATRERVLEAAREIGYPGPDPAARALRTGRTGVIAFYFAPAPPGEQLSPRVGNVLSGALEACAERNISITIPAGQARPACDGAIVLGADVEGLALEVPYVRVGPDDPADDQLIAPDARPIDEALTAIAENGHRRLAMVTDQMLAPWFARRVEDWPGEARVVTTPSESHEHGLTIGRELLNGGPQRPTAVVVVGDNLGFGLLTAITELGLRVPDDVSLVVIGNRDTFTPRMAGVRIPQRELGARAVAYLGGIMDGGEAVRADRVPCDFQLGETLGPPPA